MVERPVPGTRRPLVLHLIDGLGLGGTEQSLVELLPALRQRGVDSVIACFEHRQGAEQELRSLGFDFRVLAARRLPGRIAELRRLLSQVRPDLLQLTHFDSEVVGRLGAARRGIVVLTSLVNDRYHPVRRLDPAFHPLKLRAVQTVDGWTARHLNGHFHAVSRSTKEAAVRHLGVAPDRITIVERGRDPERFRIDRDAARRAVRAELGLTEKTPVLLNLGRQEYQKGQRHLMVAVAELRAGGVPVVALVGGPRGRASAELERLTAELGLVDAVRFLGHRKDVPQLLAAADVFVFPTLYEGMPGSVLEAMAMSTPVVASDIPPVAEVVEAGASALLVEPSSPSHLAAAVARVLGEPALAAALARRGRQLFEERFTLDRAADAMRDLYLGLAAKGAD